VVSQILRPLNTSVAGARERRFVTEAEQLLKQLQLKVSTFLNSTLFEESLFYLTTKICHFPPLFRHTGVLSRPAKWTALT
jgi:hypothetical protein